MAQVNIHEAKTHLSALLERVSQGEEIVIAKAGRPIARLVPAEPTQLPRVAGSAKGQMVVRDEFYEPLSEEILNDFGA